jgi:inner membrane protein
MDSVTQFVLGGAVGVLVMGRSQPVLKSALIGGVIGTLPDLDSFIDFGDPILDMVRHRGETHSLIWQAVAAPFIAALLASIDRSLDRFFRWWVMVLLVLTTHAGLDSMTVYGTQLFLPQYDGPIGLGSIFIIDPLYTLPLLFGVLLTVFGRYKRLLYNVLGILVSCAYLGWSAYAQTEVMLQVKQTPTGKAVSEDRILVTPTALNTLLWRVVVMHDEHYDEGFYTVLDRWRAPEKQIRFTSFKREPAIDAATMNFESANHVRRFSRGFYTISSNDGEVLISDLRMGQQPYYVFSFQFAKRNGNTVTEVPVKAKSLRQELPVVPYLEWIWARIKGEGAEPPRKQ